MLTSSFDPLAEPRDVQGEQQLGGCLTGLGEVGWCGSTSKVSLDHSLRILIGPELCDYEAKMEDLLAINPSWLPLLDKPACS